VFNPAVGVLGLALGEGIAACRGEAARTALERRCPQAGRPIDAATA
jgi:hypothetical protein